MTRDEILNMEAGREMDTLVAEKVMGFPVKIGDITGEPYHAQFGYSMPNYSTNIAAAWMVVEKLQNQYPAFNLVWVKLQILKPEIALRRAWRANFQGSTLSDAFADTAPLAICRAALLAMLEDV